jgi:hypothetical protein
MISSDEEGITEVNTTAITATGLGAHVCFLNNGPYLRA